ncbi:MAG: SPOR domain-containing protein [Candidatus Paracaedimonas acanthamoebae]|uniref:SPOR domain-containing protein n=1 Tax=Candidatus Paracaedimonas acanthamoebae TaxID=244581 RepID=A0A8J7PYK7_9PROT|nr:SPOR domain-containing protein [Candidatus Paracaedimonas acanthamoebae]
MQQSKWDQERYSQDKSTITFKVFLSNPLLRYGICLCMILGILLGLWQLSNPGADHTPAGLIPVIKPLEGPTKIRPTTNPKDTHEDKTIYQKLSDTKEPQRVENLLGGPEEPIARPLSLPEEFIGEFLEEKTEITLPDSKATKSKSDVSVIQTTKDPKEISNDLAKETDLEGAKSANVAISGSHVKTSPEKNTPSQERYCLQLGTLKTEEQAKLEWKRLSSRQVLKSYLQALKPEFKKVDLGNDTGVRIRLIAGSFTKKEAQNLCQELKKVSAKHNITLGCRVKKR